MNRYSVEMDMLIRGLEISVRSRTNVGHTIPYQSEAYSCVDIAIRKHPTTCKLFLMEHTKDVLVATLVASEGYCGPVWDIYPTNKPLGPDIENGAGKLVVAARNIHKHSSAPICAKIRLGSEHCESGRDNFSSVIKNLLVNQHHFRHIGLDTCHPARWQVLESVAR